MAIPELESFRYTGLMKDKPEYLSYVCSAFCAGIYKHGGLFPAEINP